MRKISFNKLTFYTAYFMLNCSSMLSNVNFISPYIKYFRYFYLFLIVINIFLQNRTFKTKNIITIIATIGIVIAGILETGNSAIFIYLLFLIPLKKIEFKELIHNDFKIKVSLMLFVLMMYFLNFTDPYITHRTDGTIRNSLGFAHPNYLAVILLTLTLESFFLFYKEHKILVKTIYLCNLLFIYFVTDSRTTVFTLLFFCVLLFIFKTKKIDCNNRFTKIVTSNLFLVLFAISMISTMLYMNNNEFMIKINSLLNGRLYWNSVFLKKYPINIIGYDIQIVGTRLAKNSNLDMLILDNGYLNILYFYGFFGTIFYYYIFKKIVQQSVKEKNIIILLIIVTFLIYGVTENTFYKFVINPFIFYFINYINDKDKNIYLKEVLYETN